MKRILVIGGAGYIGSHMVLKLQEKNCFPIILDNLSTGYYDAVKAGQFILGDMSNVRLVNYLIHKYEIDTVLNFASYIQVSESMQDPNKYYINNVARTLTLLKTLLSTSVKYFIFSSSAAVFGQPQYTPVDEAHPLMPINPYGFSKMCIERVLTDYDRAYGFRSVSLRYFNAAGADLLGRVGERHSPETHLIPLAIRAAQKENVHLTVYGNDYDTPDGTCIRDYIHVWDLCEAHWLALQYLWAGAATRNFNLGQGEGYSVKQVLDKVAQITHQAPRVHLGDRRLGDPSVLIASSKQAKDVLHWTPHYSTLDQMIHDAWQWELKSKK